ncbi:RHS repeat-associated core domain-containing protein [Actinoplanes sp. NPDC051859]|uniref:RHS repeat-associated core domain-containing protein n=1 Tax=Actinoplanes sp. NPDC051859 TaxID=3363909 RepID=UPI0037A39E9E
MSVVAFVVLPLIVAVVGAGLRMINARSARRSRTLGRAVGTAARRRVVRLVPAGRLSGRGVWPGGWLRRWRVGWRGRAVGWVAGPLAVTLAASLVPAGAVAAPSSPVRQVDTDCSSNAVAYSEALGSVSSSENCVPGGAEGVGPALVDPTTGDVSMSVGLGALGGGLSPAYGLTARYSSTGVDAQVALDNYAAPTKFAGLGWSLPAAEARIERVNADSGAEWDDRFRLVRVDGSSSVLSLVGRDKAGTTKYYSAGASDATTIALNTSSGLWTVTDSTGTVWYFGDAAYRSSDGYASSTVTASAGYAQACAAILVFNGTDKCAAGATEYGVRWGNWVGPSYRTSGQERYATAWGLSAVESLGGKRTTLFYAQHTQAVASVTAGLFYTKGRYLALVRTDDKDELQLSWSTKKVQEIPDPQAQAAEPDAYQEHLDVLYLGSVTAYRATASGTVARGRQSLSYEFVNADADSSSSPQYMGKRLLTNVTEQVWDTEKSSFVSRPPWGFTYGGQSDSDSVTVRRLTEADVTDSRTGAIFGLLRSVTTPAGATTTYKYERQQRADAAKVGFEVSAASHGLTGNRHVKWGPGYVLVSGNATVSGSTRNRVILYAWGSRGWSKVWSKDSTGYFNGTDQNGYAIGFDVSSTRWAATGDGVIAVLLPSYTNAALARNNCNDVVVVARDAQDRNSWAAAPISKSVCGSTSVAVGDGMVAVAAVHADTTRQAWTVWRNTTGDWSDSSATQTVSKSFTTPMSGNYPITAAQIGSGFVGFSVSNTARSSTTDTTAQTVNTDFVFVTETGLSSSVVSKSVTVPRVISSLNNKTTCKIYGYIADLAGSGSNPNLVATMRWDGPTSKTSCATWSSCPAGVCTTYSLSTTPTEFSWPVVIRGVFTAVEAAPSKAADVTLTVLPAASNVPNATNIGTVGSATSMPPGVLSSNEAVMVAGSIGTKYPKSVTNTTEYGSVAVCGYAAVTPSGVATPLTSAGDSNCLYGTAASTDGFSNASMRALDDDFVVTRNSAGNAQYWQYDPKTETMVALSGTDAWSSVVNDTAESDTTEPASRQTQGGGSWWSDLLQIVYGAFSSDTDSPGYSVHGDTPPVAVGADTSGGSFAGSYGSDSRYVIAGSKVRYRQPDGTLSAAMSWTTQSGVQGATGIADAFIPYRVVGSSSSSVGVTPLRNGAVRYSEANATSVSDVWASYLVNIELAGLGYTYPSTEQASDVDDLSSDGGFMVYESNGGSSGSNFVSSTGGFWLVSLDGGVLDFDTDNRVAMDETAMDVTVVKVTSDDGTSQQSRTYSYDDPEMTPAGEIVYGSTTVTLAGTDKSDGAGTVTYAAYAGADTSRDVYVAAAVDGGASAAGVPLVEFAADRSAKPWTTYRDALLGQIYARTETGLSGSSGSVAKTQNWVEIGWLSTASAYATGGMLRQPVVREISGRSTSDGVITTTSKWYNARNQIRTVQQRTSALAVSAGSSAGTAKTSISDQVVTTTVFQAWEMAEYRQALLADNRLDGLPYLTYTTRSSGGKAPVVESASVQTYATPSGSSVLMPSAAYQARGAQLTGIMPAISLAGQKIANNVPGSRYCAAVTTSNSQNYLSSVAGDSCSVDDAGSSLFIPHVLAGNPVYGDADQRATTTYVLESVSKPGMCLMAVDADLKTVTEDEDWLGMATCNLASAQQVTNISETKQDQVGYVSTLKQWTSAGATTCLSGLASTASGSKFDGWGGCSRSTTTSATNTVLRLVSYPQVQIKDTASTSAGVQGCLTTTSASSFASATCVSGDSTAADKTLFVLHTDGSIESVAYLGYCLKPVTDVLVVCGSTAGSNADDYDMVLAPYYKDLSSGWYEMTDRFWQCWDSVADDDWGDCFDDSAWAVSPDPDETVTTGVTQGVPVPAVIAASQDVWVKSATTTSWDSTTLLPTAGVSYAGTSGTSRRSTSMAVKYSVDGRGLSVASFGGANASQAGYLGFESYEVTDATKTSCAAFLPAGWSCTFSSVAASSSGHVGYGLSSTGSGKLTATAFTPPTDASGAGVPYVMSAWVKGGSCKLTAGGKSSDTSNTTTWQYLEVPFTTTAGTSITPTVDCASATVLDDVRYGPANGQFAAVVYDPANGYRPIGELGDTGITTKVAYGPTGEPTPYTERLNTTTRNVGSQMAAGFSMGGFSRFGGHGISIGNDAASYQRTIPNVLSTVTYGADTASFCPKLADSSSPWTACSSNTFSLPGNAWAIRADIKSGTSTSLVSWTAADGRTVAAGFYSNKFGVYNSNASCAVTSTRKSTGADSTVRQMAVIAYGDQVLILADGYPVLSMKNEATLTTATNPSTNTSVKYCQPSTATNVLAGSAPQVSVDHLDAELRSIETHQMQTMYTNGTGALTDTVTATAYDGWGKAAVRTLPMYTTPGSGTSVMTYRGVLGSFNWNRGTLGSASELYTFYLSGAGKTYATRGNDAKKALTYDSSRAEPAARSGESAGAGAAYGTGSGKTTTTTYNQWDTAGLGTAVDASSGEQDELVTSASSVTAGSGQNIVSQSVQDLTGTTTLSRVSWKTSSDTSWSSLTQASATTFDRTTNLPSGVTKADAMNEVMTPNYFSNVTSSDKHVKRAGTTDILGQHTFDTEPDLSGAQHVFRDDEGKVRYTLNTTGISASATSDGALYYSYDQYGRLTKISALVNVHKADLAAYAAAARLDSDPAVTASNSCTLTAYQYDVDPSTGALAAYSNQRGSVVKATNYSSPTSTTACATSPTTNSTAVKVDDLGRTTATYETRGTVGTGRTTTLDYKYGGLATTITYPDKNATAAFAVTSGQTSITYWSDATATPVRVEAGTAYPAIGADADDSATDSDPDANTWWKLVNSDWAGRILKTQRGDGYTETVTYDLQGNQLDKKLRDTTGTTVAGETQLHMRPETVSSTDSACGGTSDDDSNATPGKLLGRQLYGTWISKTDRDIWSCFRYDGAGRLTTSGRYKKVNGTWTGQDGTAYDYDANSNVTAEKTGTTSLNAVTGDTAVTNGNYTETIDYTAGTNKPTDFGWTNDGSSTTTTYDSNGNQTRIAFSTGIKSRIDTTYDKNTNQLLTQKVYSGTPSAVNSTATIDYTPNGLRANRTVTGNNKTINHTHYYGAQGLQPLVTTQTDTNTENLTIYTPQGATTAYQTRPTTASTDTKTRFYYPFTDHTENTVVVLNNNNLTQYTYSDYGDTTTTLATKSAPDTTTTISPTTTSATGTPITGTPTGPAPGTRYQNQYQDTYPTATITTTSADTTSLKNWLDQHTTYHYPYREYAPEIAQFTTPDPARSGPSPYAAFNADPVNNIDTDGLIAVRAAAENALNWVARREIWKGTGITVAYNFWLAPAHRRMVLNAGQIYWLRQGAYALLVASVMYAGCRFGVKYQARECQESMAAAGVAGPMARPIPNSTPAYSNATTLEPISVTWPYSTNWVNVTGSAAPPDMPYSLACFSPLGKGFFGAFGTQVGAAISYFVGSTVYLTLKAFRIPIRALVPDGGGADPRFWQRYRMHIYMTLIIMGVVAGLFGVDLSRSPAFEENNYAIALTVLALEYMDLMHQLHYVMEYRVQAVPFWSGYRALFKNFGLYTARVSVAWLLGSVASISAARGDHPNPYLPWFQFLEGPLWELVTSGRLGELAGLTRDQFNAIATWAGEVVGDQRLGPVLSGSLGHAYAPV